MTTRAEFLDRVRRAIGQRTGEPDPGTGRELVRLCEPTEDLAARFVERAKAAGIFVTPTTNANLEATITAAIQAWAPSACVIGGHSERSLAELQKIVPPPHHASVATDDLFTPGLVGVSDALAAVAETGSLVVIASATMPRALCLVPDRHLVVLRASLIVPDLLDLFGSLREPPAALTLISGPSKTADIEGILITGVHGPREVRVILRTDA